MENTRITPGPINNELLFLATEHRAYHLFHNQQSNVKGLNIRRADQKFWRIIKNHPIPVRVMNYIRAAGFEGVLQCGFKSLDHGLITALVERWRPETHTFHLPIGEVTVTLQDVEVMWGLRINGDSVTGKEQKWSDEKLNDKCMHLLGFPTNSSYFRKGNLKAKYLREFLETALPDNASDHECIQRARAYILVLLAGVLFPDTLDTYIHMNLLVLLEDFERCSRLSWGSAVLACLYRNLCKASVDGATEIAGPLMLLQLWAWCRIPATSPILPNVEDDAISGIPYGVRWNCPLSFVDVPAHMLTGYRSLLHALNVNEFLWTPYDDVLQRLSRICSSEDWVCDTYVIFWEIAEECLPSRVMRQFHLLQTIPTTRLSSVAQHRTLHKITRRGSSSKDWRNHLQAQINHWVNRRQHSINGEFSHAPITVDGYMGWYWPRTVIFITNPGPGVENSFRFHNLGGNLAIAVDGISRMHEHIGTIMGNHPESQQYMQGAYDMSAQYLRLTHADNHMQYQSTHVNPSFDNNVNRNNSPVSFGGFDLNVPWDESETQEVEEDRPRRNIRAPSCGTGGRLGHHH